MQWKFTLGYKLFRQDHKSEITVEANSQREAFETARRELRHRLVDEAIYAADHAWNHDHQMIERSRS